MIVMVILAVAGMAAIGLTVSWISDWVIQSYATVDAFFYEPLKSPSGEIIIKEITVEKHTALGNIRDISNDGRFNRRTPHEARRWRKGSAGNLASCWVFCGAND